MKLSDLLTELRENILHDRSDRTAGASDFLWSDATLVRYINEAQRRFARRGLVIRDGSTTECCQITLATDVGEYTLHQSVLGVISAKISGDTADLARTGHSALDTYHTPDPLYWDLSTIGSLPNGKPVVFTTDEYIGLDDQTSWGAPVMRVYPKPSSTYNGTVVNLRVVRMPLETLSADCLNDEPEIPEEHHLEMLDWAAYLALRIADIDAGMPKRAQEFAQSFEAHVQDARRAALRKMFAPLQWGFGRNAWSWEK